MDSENGNGVECFVLEIIRKLEKSKQKTDVNTIRQKINSNRELKKSMGTVSYCQNEVARILESMCERQTIEKETGFKNGVVKFVTRKSSESIHDNSN